MDEDAVRCPKCGNSDRMRLVIYSRACFYLGDLQQTDGRPDIVEDDLVVCHAEIDAVTGEECEHEGTYRKFLATAINPEWTITVRLEDMDEATSREVERETGCDLDADSYLMFSSRDHDVIAAVSRFLVRGGIDYQCRREDDPPPTDESTPE